MIEQLSQQHALEIANTWHYEVPYDFYDMKKHKLSKQNFLTR